MNPASKLYTALSSQNSIKWHIIDQCAIVQCASATFANQNQFVISIIIVPSSAQAAVFFLFLPVREVCKGFWLQDYAVWDIAYKTFGKYSTECQASQIQREPKMQFVFHLNIQYSLQIAIVQGFRA
jgi:hypothetical protein